MKVLREIRGEDHTVKYLIRLDDGQSVEALYMCDMALRLTYHSTVCVSSQVGCAMGCRFCATGKQGFIRNLTADEITGQVDICDRSRQDAAFMPVDAVVFAGMGEPLLNYRAVITAIQKIAAIRELRHFELATVGVVPRIYDLARYLKNSSIRLRLNLSLHAPTDEKRRALIPLTKKYGVSDIIAASDAFACATKSKIRIRYMLMKGINDTDEDIDHLIGLLRGRPFKLIISRYNDNNIENLTPPGLSEVLSFYDKIKDSVDCDIFHNFGGGIGGGCGQLRQNASLMPGQES